jgi:hypothetical protein
VNDSDQKLCQNNQTFHHYAAGITASFTILLTAASAQDALLKQAQEIF